ncbi:hypothetical protein MMC34_005949 [Xylographa carneopallida]|nr:hypothetical protein [Xylographa carneopallida]
MSSYPSLHAPTFLNVHAKPWPLALLSPPCPNNFLLHILPLFRFYGGTFADRINLKRALVLEIAVEEENLWAGTDGIGEESGELLDSKNNGQGGRRKKKD